MEKGSDSMRRLHPLKKTPVPASPPLLDDKGSLKSNPIWLLIRRITYLLVRSKDFDLSVLLIIYFRREAISITDLIVWMFLLSCL
jgi:hypothetical protein